VSNFHIHEQFTTMTYDISSSNLYGKYKDGDTQRQYYKVQDILFHLHRFRTWNACGTLTLDTLMAHAKMQSSLKQSILQQLADKITTCGNTELFELVESTYGWEQFVQTLLELNRYVNARYRRDPIKLKLRLGTAMTVPLFHADRDWIF
jgi:hypothetical protein